MSIKTQIKAYKHTLYIYKSTQKNFSYGKQTQKAGRKSNNKGSLLDMTFSSNLTLRFPHRCTESLVLEIKIKV